MPIFRDELRKFLCLHYAKRYANEFLRPSLLWPLLFAQWHHVTAFQRWFDISGHFVGVLPRLLLLLLVRLDWPTLKLFHFQCAVHTHTHNWIKMLFAIPHTTITPILNRVVVEHFDMHLFALVQKQLQFGRGSHIKFFLVEIIYPNRKLWFGRRVPKLSNFSKRIRKKKLFLKLIGMSAVLNEALCIRAIGSECLCLPVINNVLCEFMDRKYLPMRNVSFSVWPANSKQILANEFQAASVR